MKALKEIEDLSGVGEATAKKLRENGYDTLYSILASNPKTLAEVVGVSEATARQLIKEAREKSPDEFQSGENILQKESTALKITTGSKEFDNVLGGGIKTGEMTEAFGEFGSSKSQLGFQLCVNVQLPIEKGGLAKKAIFIDTENTFSAQRVEQMAKGAGLNPTEVLKNIKVARAHSTDHQIFLTNQAEVLMKKDKSIGLLVVDSATSHFRSDYVGRGVLAERQQILNKYLHKLSFMSDYLKIAVYITNQVMARPDIFFGDPTESIGGHVLKHAAQTRLYLRKAKKGTRIVRVVDSSMLPDSQAAFIVLEEGIRDVKGADKFTTEENVG